MVGLIFPEQRNFSIRARGMMIVGKMPRLFVKPTDQCLGL